MTVVEAQAIVETAPRNAGDRFEVTDSFPVAASRLGRFVLWLTGTADKVGDFVTAQDENREGLLRKAAILRKHLRAA